MLTSITKRTIHEETSSPTFNIVEHVMKRRKSYLGHILRMEPERGVRRFLLELNPDTAPFVPGSLLSDTAFETVQEISDAAQDRLEWSRDWISNFNYFLFNYFMFSSLSLWGMLCTWRELYFSPVFSVVFQLLDPYFCLLDNIFNRGIAYSFR